MECPHCGGVMTAEDLVCAACGRPSEVRERHPAWMRAEIAARDRARGEAERAYRDGRVNRLRLHVLTPAAGFPLLTCLLEPASFLFSGEFVLAMAILGPAGAGCGWLVHRLRGDLLPGAAIFGALFVAANGLRLSVGATLLSEGFGFFYGVVIAGGMGTVVGALFGLWVRDGLRRD